MRTFYVPYDYHCSRVSHWQVSNMHVNTLSQLSCRSDVVFCWEFDLNYCGCEHFKKYYAIIRHAHRQYDRPLYRVKVVASEEENFDGCWLFKRKKFKRNMSKIYRNAAKGLAQHHDKQNQCIQSTSPNFCSGTSPHRYSASSPAANSPISPSARFTECSICTSPECNELLRGVPAVWQFCKSTWLPFGNAPVHQKLLCIGLWTLVWICQI